MHGYREVETDGRPSKWAVCELRDGKFYDGEPAMTPDGTSLPDGY
jgi:hypothetical protein